MIKGALDPNWYKVTLPCSCQIKHVICNEQANISDWVFQVLLWPNGLGVALWEGDMGIGKPDSIPSQPIMNKINKIIDKKGKNDITNGPSISDWVFQVALWPSGFGHWTQEWAAQVSWSLHGSLHDFTVKEQPRSQLLFSSECVSAICGSTWMSRWKN